jgi:cytochrome c6
MVNLRLKIAILAATFVLGAAWVAPALAQTPPAVDKETFAAGFAQYNRTCAQCHGRNMVQAGVTVYDLRRFPLDDKERFLNSVNNGKGNGGMPGFKESLSAAQIELIWAYVTTRGKAPE